MEITGEFAFFTLLGLGLAVLIFLAALVFVNSARRGNRRFKWGSRGRTPGRM